MGNYPSMGSKGGTVVGALELNLCKDSCCMCAPAWNGCCMGSNACKSCCPGLVSPNGPEWEAAQAGFKVLQDEAYHIAMVEAPKRCGCCSDVFTIKRLLDEKWTERANEFLKEHGLSVEVCAFFTSDGKSSSPHLVLQFTKVDK